VAPHAAYFGAKDGQQALVIRRMGAISTCPSRSSSADRARAGRPRHVEPHAYLDPADASAPSRCVAVDAAEGLGRRRASAKPARLAAAGRAAMASSGWSRSTSRSSAPRTGRPWRAIDDEALVAVAATSARARLIDNTTGELPRVAEASHEHERRETPCSV